MFFMIVIYGTFMNAFVVIPQVGIPPNTKFDHLISEQLTETI